MTKHSLTIKNKKRVEMGNGKQTKTELLQLQKGWEEAKKKVRKDLSKEKSLQKKEELRLIADYFSSNYVDLENKTINSKHKKTDLTNICGSKEFQETTRPRKSTWKN